MIGGFRRLVWTVLSDAGRGRGSRGRQPVLQIPPAIRASHQDQTGPGQRNRAELEMAPQQSHPSKAGIQMLRAKKIFAPEGGVFADRYSGHVQFWSRQNLYGELSDIHMPPEGSFQARRQVSPHLSGSDQHGGSKLRAQQNDERHNANPHEFSNAIHADASLSNRL